MRSDTFYVPDAAKAANAIGRDAALEYNVNRDDFRDGVQLRSRMTPLDITAKNYAFDSPQDKRTTCYTCKHHGSGVKDMRNGLYRCWCHVSFEQGSNGWKQEPYTLKDNGCRDWLPLGPDCIG